jgi:hypothetical protein
MQMHLRELERQATARPPRAKKREVVRQEGGRRHAGPILAAILLPVRALVRGIDGALT